MNALELWQRAKNAPEYQHIGGSARPTPFDTHDALGRRQPRRLGIHDYLILVARIDPARVRQVPTDAITEEGLDEGGEFALVECPCGAKPIVRATLECCPDCKRYYVLITVGIVYLAYGAMSPPPRVA